MTKEQKKKEKQILQQQVSNVIRDRKGRPFFINEHSGKFYQLFGNEEGKFYIYDARLLFSIIPIMLVELVKKEFMPYALLVSVVISLGFEVFYQSLVGNLSETNRVPKEVKERYESLELLKAKRSDLMLKVLLGVVIVVMIVTNPYSYTYNEMSGIQRFLGNFAFVLSIGFSLTPIVSFVKTQNQIRKKKKQAD